MSLLGSRLNKYDSPPYCWVEMYAGRVVWCPWWVTVRMPTGQSDRQTDRRTTERYITLSARRGQCNKQLHYRPHTLAANSVRPSVLFR